MSNYLIIGGSSGIGNAIVNDLLNDGHRVWSTYNQHPIEEKNNLNTSFWDVLSGELDTSFLPESLDGLVYAPGAIDLKPFHRISKQEFSDDYQLQVLGAIEAIQLSLPALKKAENPSVVCFSTVAVQNGFNYHSKVASSKGALEGLVRSLAAEFAPKIRVNAIAPSLTDTPLAEKLLNSDEKRASNAQRHPLKRIGEAQDVSSIASFLLSDRASWITGQVISVDGGISRLRV